MDEYSAIGQVVAVEAMDRFEMCDAKSDFCIQFADPGGAVVVFGGTNRVIFDARGPIFWKADPKYCTSRFLEKWDELYG